MKSAKPKKVIYFDYAATTPMDRRVLSAMLPYLQSEYGNPSSLYDQGMRAKLGIEEARERIAKILNARASEIIFTAGGTESINLAIFGIVRKYLDKAEGKKLLKPHIITTAIEHPAVLESVKALKKKGADVTYLNPDNEGFVSLKDLQKAIKKNTVLVSIMYANNEIGTIQPIQEFGVFLRKLNIARRNKKLPEIIFHSDACQAAGALNLNVQKMNVDLMSINGSKIYGPKQSGLLYKHASIAIEPLVYGGGQENGLRSGTENVAGIVGLAKALSIADASKEQENARLIKLRNYLYKNLIKKSKDILLNGPEILDTQGITSGFKKGGLKRLPNNLNITVKNVEGEALLLYLNAKGIEISTGSACSSTSIDPSHVLLAIGRNKNEAKNSIRITLGRQSNKEQIDRLLTLLPGLIKQLQSVRFELNS